MSKQVNLSLASAYDVTVLANGEKSIIIRKDYPKGNKCWVYLGRYLLLCDNNGKAEQGASYDILDILRNGASIFEQSNQ